MKHHLYKAWYKQIYAATPSWDSRWLNSAYAFKVFQNKTLVQRFLTALQNKKNVRKSGFATLLWYNIPQSEPSAAAAVVATASSPSSSFASKFFTGRDIYGHSNSSFHSLGHLLSRTKPTLSLSHLSKPISPSNRLLAQSFRTYHSENNTYTDPDSSNKNNVNKNNKNNNDQNDQNNNCSCSSRPPSNPGSFSNNHSSQFRDSNPPNTSSTFTNNKTISAVTETHLTVTDSRRSSLQAPTPPKSTESSSETTKQEFLSEANSTAGRLWIHLRWALFKQIRPLSTDDISALFSWILVGNIIWILLGTTTFFSIVLFTMNTVFAQEYIAELIGNFVTKNTGITVVFENAIVPHWGDGMISFKKVFVSKRPNRGNHRVQKGSQAAAAADAAASSNANDDSSTSSTNVQNLDSGNYTQFDLTIDTVSVTLSLSKWVNGGGIVKDLEVKGLRGIVDRRHVIWDPEDDPVKYKNVHKPGDFEFENFKMEDALVTLYNPDGFRPFRVSIFNCELPRLRKHWLFYDILSANNMSGTYDDSLFTIHPRQLEYVSNYDKSAWKKINRLRIDAVNIDHLNRGVQGPFGWIENGNVDLCADIMFPAEDEDFNFTQVLRDIKTTWNRTNWNGVQKGRIEDENNRSNYVYEEGEWKRKVIHAETKTLLSFNKDPNTLTDNKYMVIDLRVQLNNSRAVVPIFTSDLTYINNALIRPIVAYINSRDTYIPINCRIIKKYNDFEGSWTMFDSRLMDDISAAVYDAFAASIMDDDARAMRMKKVGFWSLQLALQLFLVSLGALA